jgi:polysaccharide biosynthesis protein PslH
VSTRIGAEGIELVDGRDAVIADSASDFASACIRLLATREDRDKLAGAGRQVVLTTYAWPVVGETAAAAIMRLL